MQEVLSEEALHKRKVFLEIMFKGQSGYLCLCRRSTNWEEKFFQWPEQAEAAYDTIAAWTQASSVYFCPTLLRRPHRTKENVQPSNVVWADLDNCPPGELLIRPTITLETSPGRFQALWLLQDTHAPLDLEEVSRRIAYYHRDAGADVSGWDLTQLLRVPLTYNHKYGGINVVEPPHVKIIDTGANDYSLSQFTDVYPPVKGFEPITESLPSELPQEDALSLLERFTRNLPPAVTHRFHTEPDLDWSKALWQLMMGCFEAGMSPTEVFVVAKESACNKYRRDGQSDEFLWKDVKRAEQKHKFNTETVSGPVASLEPLLTEEERAWAESHPTFVEEYIEWAKTVGDAAPQYHEAGAFVLLSALLAGRVRLPTSFGLVLPNLWFMILADTTLTRKSTAMDLSVEMLAEIDSEAVLATDGSIEGLFSALSTRPGRPSVFLRDEFSGLLEMMAKKDYYAGMGETLTKLYDGKFQKKILRRETIEVKEPVLIMFAGGIRDRVLGHLTYEHVASGFVPRFVFITAESDPSKIRPLGPPTERTIEGREKLKSKLVQMHLHYTAKRLEAMGTHQVEVAPRWDAKLTTEAWTWYNRIEHAMMQSALKSPTPDLMTPTFDRMCKSGLKIAVLIAATRMEPELTVTKDDLVKAFWFIERWRGYTMEVMNNVGRTATENQLQRILKMVRQRTQVMKSEIMVTHHLNSKEAAVILDTLHQRGLIDRQVNGRSERITATTGG